MKQIGHMPLKTERNALFKKAKNSFLNVELILKKRKGNSQVWETREESLTAGSYHCRWT